MFESTSSLYSKQVQGKEYRDYALKLVLGILKEMRGRNTLKIIFDDFFGQIFNILKVKPLSIVLHELFPIIFEYFEIWKPTKLYWEGLKLKINNGGLAYKE
jgi:phosphatidylglycerophosphatase A